MKNTIQQFYWSEDYLYTVYRLANAHRFAQKKLLNFEYLRPPKQQASSFWFYLVNKLVPETGIVLDGLIFQKDLYKQYYLEDYDKMLKRIETGGQVKDAEASKREATLRKVFNNNFNFEDLLALPLPQASMFEWFEFNADLSKETADKLKKYLDNYIENYIAEKLLIDKENITVFSQQRGRIDMELMQEKKKFGDSFVFSYSNSAFSFSRDLFFVHNLLALEHLNLIAVEDMYILDYEKAPSVQTERYNAKITILPNYVDEYEEKQKEYYKYLTQSDDQKIEKVILEIEQSNVDLNLIVANVERRFQTLLEHKKQRNFLMVYLDYINYLGRTKILGSIIEKLVLQNKIDKKTFFELCIDFIVSTVGQEIYTRPSFLTKKIDKKLNTSKEILDFFQNEARKVKEAKNQGKTREFFNLTDISRLSVNDDDLLFAGRLHNDIMEELTSLRPSREEQKKLLTKAVFNSNDGILTFHGTAIDFSRKQNQKDLLSTLFKESQKNWCYDEIQEDWDKLLDISDLPKEYWRKFYTAGDEINTQVAIETGIKDFILKNTKQLRINSKYV